MMPSRPPIRHAVVFVVLAALVLPTSAVAQDLDRVVEQREALEEDLATATAAYEDLVAQIATAEEDLATLQQRTAALEREAAEVSEALVNRARAVYKRSDGSILTSVLGADGPQGAIERAQFLSALTSRDRGRLEGAQSLRVQLEQSRAMIEDKARELDGMREEFAQLRDALEGRLAQTRAVESELRSRRERQRIIQRGVQNGTYACIIATPYHFRDSWGAPRSGGRRHKGTDVFGRMNANVYAFSHGRVSRVSSSRLGGLGLYLWGDDGVQYYFSHLNGIAPGIRAGSRVEAGQLIAYNGNTGNARGGAPHVHFEVHPGGGRAVNPYPWLAPACFG